MSYILEALKKSEQERNPDKVPDLSTHHRAIATEEKSGFPWVWLVIVLVVINLGALYWFLVMRPASVEPTTQPLVQAQTEAAPQTSVPQETPTPVATPQQVVEQPVLKAEPEPQPEPEPEVVVPQEMPAVVEAKPAVEPEPILYGPPKFAQLPHITELSQSIQSQLPAISFSTHIYVKDGGSFVIINNRNLSDGMNLGNGIVLEKIVREGVILSFRDRYFTLNSMESWQN